MEIKDELDYTLVLYMLNNLKDFPSAIMEINISRPDFEMQGMLGYNRARVKIETLDISTYAALYEKAVTDAYHRMGK